MQPCSTEMQGLNNINSLLNSSQISLPDHNHNTSNNHALQQIQHLGHMDPTSQSQDDFLKQMLSNLPSSSWNLDPNPFPSHVENVAFPYDEHSNLASKFRNHQITETTSKAAALMLHQHLLMASRNDVVNPAADGSVQPLYNGFAGSLPGAAPPSNHTQHFQHPQGQNQVQVQVQNFGASGGASNQAPGGGAPGQPKQRVRARRGQATDPHSIAERLRRERIAERMKALQELVPNANKTDKASMLDDIIDYVKFLQLQVKVLSMSRLGGAAAVAPLVADMSSEGGGDCIQTNGNHARNQTTASSSNDSLTMTEQQVAKLMEEDMGSAMQYLQGKGLCLMPISLANAISTATCHTRNPLINNVNGNPNPPVIASNGDGPSSPGMSVLTVQSGTVGNGDAVKDAASVSKP